MSNAKLSSPWITFVHELDALFDPDPDITIYYEDKEPRVKLYVESTYKAEALAKLLPTEKTFGNITLKIDVVPANENTDRPVDLLKRAFEGNPVLEQVACITNPFGTINYAIFKREVVQFYNDQMDDAYGNKNTLYQEIAKDVFGQQDGVYFCTSAL